MPADERVHEQGEEGRVPDRYPGKRFLLEQQPKRDVAEAVDLLDTGDGRRHRHRRLRDPASGAAEVATLVLEADRDASTRMRLPRRHGGDRPVRRSGKKLRPTAEHEERPRRNTGLELLEERTRVRNELRRRARAARHPEAGHRRGGQHVRLAARDAVDPRSELVVGPDRHPPSEVLDRANGADTVLAAELRPRIRPQDALQDLFLTLRDAPRRPPPATRAERRVRHPRGVREQEPHVDCRAGASSLVSRPV